MEGKAGGGEGEGRCHSGDVFFWVYFGCHSCWCFAGEQWIDCKIMCFFYFQEWIVMIIVSERDWGERYYKHTHPLFCTHTHALTHSRPNHSHQGSPVSNCPFKVRVAHLTHRLSRPWHRRATHDTEHQTPSHSDDEAVSSLRLFLSFKVYFFLFCCFFSFLSFRIQFGLFVLWVSLFWQILFWWIYYCRFYYCY